MRFLSIVMLPLTAACVAADGEAPSGSLGNADGGNCNAAPVQSFIGQRASEAAGARILSASGARELRWGGPGSVWTMDYRPSRVNVRYDDRQIIAAITCG